MNLSFASRSRKQFTTPGQIPRQQRSPWFACQVLPGSAINFPRPALESPDHPLTRLFQNFFGLLRSNAIPAQADNREEKYQDAIL